MSYIYDNNTWVLFIIGKTNIYLFQLNKGFNRYENDKTYSELYSNNSQLVQEEIKYFVASRSMSRFGSSSKLSSYSLIYILQYLRIIGRYMCMLDYIIVLGTTLLT